MSPSSRYHWSASAFLQRVPRIVSTGDIFWPTKLEICRFLQSGCVVRLESLLSFTPIQGCPPPAVRQCFLAPPLPPCQQPGCTPVSHQRLPAPPSILGYWRKPFLFNKGHIPMFPRCCCCVLGETTPPHALPATQDGQCLGAAWGTHSDLPHRCRQGCKFSLTECQESPRDVFLKNSPIWMGRTFLGSTSC